MDYEKKYNDALERAKSFQEKYGGDYAGYIFPELRESEDEKMRKAILAAIRQGLDTEEALAKYNVTYDDVEAWLEKQKEPENVSASTMVPSCWAEESSLQKAPNARQRLAEWSKTEEGKAKYEEVAKEMREEVQKEHQNNSDAPNESSWSGIISSSDKDKNLDEIAQDYVDGVKEYNPEPTWDLMQTAVCYGYHLAEQEEQKPVEWSEKHIADVFEKVGLAKIVREQGNDELTNAVQSAMIELSKTGPAEWSEEDRLHYTNVLEALEYVKGCKSDYDKIEAVKSDIAWLKSLRPSWKPSEEQMEELNKVRTLNPGLDAIYQQLKNM